MLISADADGQGCFPEAVLQPESLFLLADIIVFQAQTQIFTMIVADINVRIFPLIFVEPDLKKTSAGCCPVAAHAKGRCHQAGSCLTDDGGIAVDGLSVFQDIWNCLIVVGLAGGHLLIRKCFPERGDGCNRLIETGGFRTAVKNESIPDRGKLPGDPDAAGTVWCCA